MAFWTVLLAGVLVATWHRPFFGTVFSLVYALPAAYLVQRAVKGSGQTGADVFRRPFVWIGAGLVAAVSHFGFRPPSAEEIFVRGFGFPVPADVRDLRSWSDQWGIDPSYDIRFVAGPETIERLAKSMRVSEDKPPRATDPIWRIGRRADWCKRDAIRSPRTWTRSPDADVWTRLCVDPDTGVVYFLMMNH